MAKVYSSLYMNDLLSQYLSGISSGVPEQVDVMGNPTGYTSPYAQAAMDKARGPNLLDQARTMYPRLQNMDIGYKESFDRPNPGYLEYWPEKEIGAPNFPRPKEFPLDKFGVEVYRKDTRPEDIAADITSHNLVYNDPVLKNIYSKFEGSLNEDQQKRLKQQYYHYIKNEHNPESKTPTYKEWYDRSGLPGWFRGYTFNQWPEDFTSKVYTPEQRKLLDKAIEHLKSK